MNFKSILSMAVRTSAVTLALLGISVVDAAAQTTTKVNVGRPQIDNFMFTPIDVGLKEGIFAKHGLEVVSYNFGGGARILEGLASGAIDIGLGAGPNLAPAAKGAPIIGISVVQEKPATQVLVVGPDGPKTIADLKGKTVAVSTAGSLTEFLAKSIVLHEGWKPGDLNIQPLGAASSMAAALKAGQIDGMVANLATAYVFENSGDGRILTRFPDMVPDFDNHVIMANTNFIAEHPDATRAFLVAWNEAVQYMKDHRDETIAITGPVMGSDAKITGQIYDELINTFSATGEPNLKGLEVIKQSLVETGDLSPDTDMKKMIDTQFLPDHN